MVHREARIFAVLQYTVSEAIAIIQCKEYGEMMLGYQPTYGLQILSPTLTRQLTINLVTTIAIGVGGHFFLKSIAVGAVIYF